MKIRYILIVGLLFCLQQIFAQYPTKPDPVAYVNDYASF